MPHCERRTYDHRVKAQVIAAGNPDLFPELKIPRPTGMSWIRRGIGDIVSLDDIGLAEVHFRERIVTLERRVRMLVAVLRLVLLLLRLSGFRLELERVPNADDKRRLLGAIERARVVMSLVSALRVLSKAFDDTIPRMGQT